MASEHAFTKQTQGKVGNKPSYKDAGARNQGALGDESIDQKRKRSRQRVRRRFRNYTLLLLCRTSAARALVILSPHADRFRTL
jgi:hypothetical protein